MRTQPVQSVTTAIPVRARRAPHPGIPAWLLLTGGVVIAASALFSLLLLAGVLLLGPARNRIAADVSVGGVPVGGLSAADAADAIAAAFAAQNVTLTDGDRMWVAALRDLGIGVDVDATVAQAQEAARGVAVVPVYTLDLVQTQAGLVALSDQINIAAAPGRAGRAVEIPVVLDRLRQNPAAALTDGTLELAMIETEALPEETRPTYSGATTTHIVERGQELLLIAREYGVSMQDILDLNSISNPDLLYVGQELIIPAAGIYTPSALDAPPAPTSIGRSIVIATAEQRIYAYENGQLVRSHLVSTGRSVTPTVRGDFKVYVKYRADDMSGPDYFLPQVPYTMYFYQGYAIHGTYWHNSFGRPMSHGCVNLPVDEAGWFFNWAEVGTPVRVI